MQPTPTSAKDFGTGAGRAASSGACSFLYEQTDIEPGVTLTEWRRAGCAPRRPSLWARVRRVSAR